MVISVLREGSNDTNIGHTLKVDIDLELNLKKNKEERKQKHLIKEKTKT